jgi:dTDP-4-amino-4,6-dideoxygalactose transaminase
MARQIAESVEEFLVFGSPRIEEQSIEDVADVLRSGWLGSGPRCKAFEAAFESYVQAGAALAMNSCTAALHLALLALDIGPGDEVITTPMTFCATSNVIVHAGATPVFADIDPITWNLDPAQVAGKITARTKAILPVHYLGRPCDVEAFDRIARKHNLKVIYDAAHAIEARVGGKSVANWGDATCYSFHTTKNITTGEGGMLVSQQADIIRKAAVLRQNGLDADSWTRYQGKRFGRYLTVTAGFKYNMSDINAAIGLTQLPRIEEWLVRREEIWTQYLRELEPLPFILPAPVAEGTRHARHLFTPLLDLDRAGFSRDELIEQLKERGVGTGIHFVGLHDHPFYQQQFDLKRLDYPQSAFVTDRTFSVPLSSKLTDHQVNRVIGALRDVLR